MASWDTSSPGDGDIVSQFPLNERTARAAVKTNFGVDHHEEDDAQIGFHEQVTLIERTTDPVAIAGQGFVYAKEIGAKVELVYLDEDDNIVQITKGGALDAFLGGIETAVAARAELELGSAAVEADTRYNHRSNNLSDLDSFSTARSNLSVPSTLVTFTAGDGLTGGGSLAANRTFNIGAGNGISVSANAVAMSGSYSGTFTATEVQATSDARLKENIAAVDGALSMVSRMRATHYLNTRLDAEQYGVIAQEVREVMPEAVGKSDDGFLSVSYAQITAVLLQAVKELAERVEQLEQRR